MPRRRFLTLACGLAAYVLLLRLLVLSESSVPGATITTFPAAIWYSLSTLTTVGYGDVAPVTDWGRLIGAVFQICSYGLLAFLIGAVVTLARGRLLPLLRLFFSEVETGISFRRSIRAPTCWQKRCTGSRPKKSFCSPRDLLKEKTRLQAARPLCCLFRSCYNIKRGKERHMYLS